MEFILDVKYMIKFWIEFLLKVILEKARLLPCLNQQVSESL